MFADGIGPGGLDSRWGRRGLRYEKILNFKPRLTEIEDIFKAQRKTKMTHVALDAVSAEAD
jgi:hypothetical protein